MVRTLRIWQELETLRKKKIKGMKTEKAKYCLKKTRKLKVLSTYHLSVKFMNF